MSWWESSAWDGRHELGKRRPAEWTVGDWMLSQDCGYTASCKLQAAHPCWRQEYCQRFMHPIASGCRQTTPAYRHRDPHWLSTPLPRFKTYWAIAILGAQLGTCICRFPCMYTLRCPLQGYTFSLPSSEGTFDSQFWEGPRLGCPCTHATHAHWGIAVGGSPCQPVKHERYLQLTWIELLLW